MFYITERLSEHIGETPEGFLLCKDVPLTRVGEFEYTAQEVPIEGSKDGLVRIQRDEGEVFDANTIASFEGKPFTINHPDEFVTPENWIKYAHGAVQNVRRGEGELSDLLIGDILITTEKGIELVKSGLREVSCGYDAQYEQTGEGRGRQFKIVGNHVALVTKGRAGGRCAIQDMDSVNANTITKEDVKNMRAKDLFKRIFPKSRFADSLEDADLGEPLPVEGADDAERAANAAKEAEDAAKRAVEAAEQASAAAAQAAEGANKEPEQDDDPPPDKPPEDIPSDTPPADQPPEGVKPSLDEILDRLTVLEDLVRQILEIDEGTEGASDADPDLEEEGTEEKEEFEDVASDIEIIAPDMSVAKPTKDSAINLRDMKRKALVVALTKDYASVIKPLLKGKGAESLKGREVDVVFAAASRMVSMIRDSKVQKDSINPEEFFRKSSNEIAKVSEANKKFWKK